MAGGLLGWTRLQRGLKVHHFRTHKGVRRVEVDDLGSHRLCAGGLVNDVLQCKGEEVVFDTQPQKVQSVQYSIHANPPHLALDRSCPIQGPEFLITCSEIEFAVIVDRVLEPSSGVVLVHDTQKHVRL